MDGGTNTSRVMHFGAMQRFARLVPACRNTRLWDEVLRQQICLCLGAEAFVDRMQALVEPQRAAAREISKAQRRTTRRLPGG